MAILVPIWNDKHETARRVRGRISAIMKWAIAEGHRDDNPAGEAIAAALPKPNGVKQHHRALPHAEVGAALAKVRQFEGWPPAKLCFEFVTLCAVRSGEARGARWDEVDPETAVWTIPAERTKAGREHRVPLTGRAMEVLAEAQGLADGSGLVFPSPTGRTLTNAAMARLCNELGLDGHLHGMRTAFRSWCAEQGVAREIAEAALGHAVQGVEASYMRSDLIEARREVMADWATYLA